MEINEKLTTRQAKFVDLYIETGNAYQSYCRAGYACNSSNRYVADVNACRLLKTAKVAAAVSDRLEEHCKSSMVRFETKRLALWKIAQECHETDPKAAVAAIAELNRMDGHYADSKVKPLATGFTFDAELLPPDGVQN